MEFDQLVSKRKRHSSEDGYVAEMVVQPPASSPVVSPEPGEFYMMETLMLPSGKLASCVKRTMRAALVALQDLCTLNGLARKDEIGPMARDLRNIRPALGSPLHTADARNTFLDQVVAFRHGLAHSNFEFLSDYVALAELVKVAAFLDELGSANPDVKSFVFWIVAEIIMRSGQKPHSALRPSAPKSERVSSFADLPTVPGVDIAKVVGDLLDDVYIAFSKFVARRRGEFPVVSTASLETIASGLVDVQRKQLREHRGRPVEELPVHRHLTLRPGTSVAATMRWLKWNLSTFATWSVPGKDVSAFEALRVITSIIEAAKIIGHGVDDMCSLLLQVLCTYFQTIKIRTIGKERESRVFGNTPRKKNPRRGSSMSSRTDSDSSGRNSRDRHSSNRNSSNRDSSNRDRSNRNYCGSGNGDSCDRDRCDHDCGDLNRLDRDSCDHAKLLCPRRGRDRDSSDHDSSDRDSSDRDSRNGDSSDHDSSNSSDRKESNRGSSDCHRSNRGNSKRGRASGGGCKHASSERTRSICDGRDRTRGNHYSRDRDCGDLDSYYLDSGDHASNDRASTDSMTAGRKKGAFKKRKSCR